VIVVIAIAAVSLAVAAWTATVVSIPRGYIIACAVLSLILVWFAFWRPRITVPIAAVIASLSTLVARREFYGQLPLLSLRSLQSFAIWTFIFAAAVLLRVALFLVRGQPVRRA
jgi:hypothetical protein